MRESPSSAPGGGGQPERLLSRGYQGSVFLVDTPDGPRIVKRTMGNALLRTVRRAMLRREFGAYRRLDGIPGVPRCFGLTGDELVLEFIPGRSLRELRDELADPGRFFALLRETVEAIHARGVAHADMKRKDNILVTADEHPCLIDFGAAVTSGEGAFRRYLFTQARRIDYNAWVKLKYQCVAPPLSAEDAELFRPTWFERVAAAVRRPWRRLTARRWRKARRNRR